MGQFLVKASGNIIDQQEKVYPVVAPTKDEAVEVAKNHFIEEFNVANDEIFLKASGRFLKSVLALVFMTIPILLSFVKWIDGHEVMSIQPTLLSSLYAFLIYSAFIVRNKGIQRTIHSWIDVSFFLMVPLLLSAFIRAIITTKEFTFFTKKISIDTSAVIMIAILLSWLGLKLVSTACMMGIGILSMGSILNLSKAMGSVWGTVFIVCSFAGFLFYFSIEPAIVEAIPLALNTIRRGSNYVKTDFNVAKSRIKGAVSPELKQETSYNGSGQEDEE